MCVLVFYLLSVHIIIGESILTSIYTYYMMCKFKVIIKLKLTTVAILVNFPHFMVNNSSLHVKSKVNVMKSFHILLKDFVPLKPFFC